MKIGGTVKEIITAGFLVNQIKAIFNGCLQDEKIEENKSKLDLKDYLSIKWFDRKIRLESNEDWYKSLNLTLGEIFGDVTIQTEAVTFSQDIDQKSIDCVLEFLCPTNKIKHLEYALSIIRNKTVGKSMNFIVGKTAFTMFFTLNALQVGDIQIISQGEIMIATVACNISLMPLIDTYADYKVSFSFDGGEKFIDAPLNSISIVKLGNKKNVPFINSKFVASRNLSCVTMWGISYWNLNNELNKTITNCLLSDDYDFDKPFILKIVYRDKEFTYPVIFDEIKQEIENNNYVPTSIKLSRYSKFEKGERNV